MDNAQTFAGVYAAMVTPMDAGQNVDYPGVAAYADYLVNSGVHGIIPLGSTGEYYALNSQERLQVVAETLRAVNGRVPVLVGTNGGSTREVIEYSIAAEKQGAAGLLLAPPYYSLPTPDELYEHFKAIDGAIDIPVMLYNYPGRTGVDMTPEFIERLTALRNIRYVKESTGDITRISELIRRCGDRLKVFCGCDSVALESFVLGAAGWVGGIVNVIPRCHVKLYDLTVTKQDIPAALDFYYQLLPVLQAIENSGKYTQLVKAGCTAMGRPVGGPRQPLNPASPDEIRQLTAMLETVKKYEMD